MRTTFCCSKSKIRVTNDFSFTNETNTVIYQIIICNVWICAKFTFCRSTSSGFLLLFIARYTSYKNRPLFDRRQKKKNRENRLSKWHTNILCKTLERKTTKMYAKIFNQHTACNVYYYFTFVQASHLFMLYVLYCTLYIVCIFC